MTSKYDYPFAAEPLPKSRKFKKPLKWAPGTSRSSQNDKKSVSKVVDECIKYLLPIDLSIGQKNILKTQNLLSGQSNDYYWTGAWTVYTQDPTDENNKQIVKNRLDSLFLTIIQLAEFQLM